MSIPYEDTILIECDRNACDVKQEDNKALWVNQLNDSVMMLPGDRVEVFNSFINDSGSGSTNPVEFRGSNLKKTHTIKQTLPLQNIVGDDNRGPVDYRTFDAAVGQLNFYTAYSAFQTYDEVVQLRDNVAKTTINYYKTMDGQSYVQLPRRFYPPSSLIPIVASSTLWQIEDSEVFGRTHRERNDTAPSTGLSNTDDRHVYGYVIDDLRSMRFTDLATTPGCIRLWNLKNDNSKFTIFRRRLNCNPLNENVPVDFPVRGILYQGSPDLTEFFPPYYARDPEYYEYDIYRETLTLSVDDGFSAAKNIADDITGQMRETEILPTEKRPHQIDMSVGAGARPEVIYDLNKRVESKTYKTFDACNEETMALDIMVPALYNGTNPANPNVTNPVHPDGHAGVRLVHAGIPVDGRFGGYVVTEATDRQAARYYQSYENIAIKRPEIYDAGTNLNDIFGFQIATAKPDTTNQTEGIVLDVPYYDHNDLVRPLGPQYTPSRELLLLKAFFESQAHYPELFSEENVINMYPPSTPTNPYWSTTSGDVFVNVDNARFLHFNAYFSTDDIGINANSNIIEADTGRLNPDGSGRPDVRYTQLGNSYYDYRGTNDIAGTGAPVFNRALNENTQSSPFYTYYDPTQKDTFYTAPNNLQDDAPNNLAYGFAGAKGQTVADNKIILYPNKIINTTHNHGVGLPSSFYHTVGGFQFIEEGQKVGFDRHWNAWGTCAIVLCSGIPTFAYGSGVMPPVPPGTGKIFQFTPGEQTADLAQPNSLVGTYPDANTATILNNVATGMYNRYTYCGADYPEFGFDGEYFFFKNLHTPLNLGNQSLTDQDEAGEEAAATDVYKINPIQQYTNYTPVQFPYEPAHEYHLLGATDPSNNDLTRTRTNSNLEKFALFDTTTGIFFEDFGYSEEAWDSGLWGRLGFTYAQFNSATNNRGQRVTSKNKHDLKVVTTNCEIEAKDSKGWCVDQFNQSVFDGTIAHPQNIYVLATNPTSHNDYKRVCQYPRITEKATSMIIQAQNYPLSLEEGYYTIRSDIVPQSSFVSGNGNTHLPIVGIVNKQSPQGDFYISPSSELRFTITKPQIVTAIKVAICDPDGEFAILNDRSSVIFKLTRDRQIDPNVAREVFEKFSKKGSL